MPRTLRKIELARIKTIGWLPRRENMGDLVSLARSIAANHDVDLPLKVRPTSDGFYELIWGNRRLEAAKLAGLESVSCIVEEIDDEKVLKENIIENLHRENRNPLEEGELFHLWKKMTGKTYDEIAKTLGLHPKYVYNRVELLKLPEPLKEMIKTFPINGNVPILPLMYIKKVPDLKLQLQLLREVLEGKLSVEELRKRINEYFSGYGPGLSYRGKATNYFDLTVPLCVEDMTPANFVNVRERGIKPRKEFTHFDTPSLYFPNGKTIDQYPLDWFISKAVVVDARETDKITVPFVKKALQRNYPLAGMTILLYTGWAAKRGTEQYYTHPEVGRDLADWLVDHRVKMIGVDMPDLEKGDDRYAHKKLLGNDILLLENLGDMSPIAGRIVTLYAFPLNVAGFDAAPARAIARLRVRRRLVSKVAG